MGYPILVLWGFAVFIRDSSPKEFLGNSGLIWLGLDGSLLAPGLQPTTPAIRMAMGGDRTVTILEIEHSHPALSLTHTDLGLTFDHGLTKDQGLTTYHGLVFDHGVLEDNGIIFDHGPIQDNGLTTDLGLTFDPCSTTDLGLT
jgi:hypothetical protein